MSARTPGDGPMLVWDDLIPERPTASFAGKLYEMHLPEEMSLIERRQAQLWSEKIMPLSRSQQLDESQLALGEDAVIGCFGMAFPDVPQEIRDRMPILVKMRIVDEWFGFFQPTRYLSITKPGEVATETDAARRARLTEALLGPRQVGTTRITPPVTGDAPSPISNTTTEPVTPPSGNASPTRV